MGVVSGGALWRCLCQSIRSFEGRRIFEMGIRVRRRAEKSSSSSAAAAAGMAGVERKERASGRVESREGRAEVAKRVDSALDQGPLSLAFVERRRGGRRRRARVDVEGCNAGMARRGGER